MNTKLMYNEEGRVKQWVEWEKGPPHQGAASREPEARRSSRTTRRTSRIPNFTCHKKIRTNTNKIYKIFACKRDY
jgi:hypothetical protein